MGGCVRIFAKCTNGVVEKGYTPHHDPWEWNAVEREEKEFDTIVTVVAEIDVRSKDKWGDKEKG